MAKPSDPLLTPGDKKGPKATAPISRPFPDVPPNDVFLSRSWQPSEPRRFHGLLCSAGVEAAAAGTGQQRPRTPGDPRPGPVQARRPSPFSERHPRPFPRALRELEG